jgi:hypothetical protein
MHSEAHSEHRWLTALVGTWRFENECVMGPGGETAKSSGQEVVRALGDLWVVGEMTGEMPGGDSMTALMTLGFDPARGKFVGSWVGSPMTHMFVYEGSLDADRRILTLDTSGPSFSDPSKTTRYRDVVEVRSPTERLLRSEMLGDDGHWIRFMSGVFRRVS